MVELEVRIFNSSGEKQVKVLRLPAQVARVCGWEMAEGDVWIFISSGEKQVYRC